MNYILTGPFRINTWIVPLWENYCFVVDPAGCKTTGDFFAIKNYLSQNNLVPVAFFCTHGHFDHIAGTGAVKEQFPSVPVLLHKKDLFLAGPSSADTQGETLIYMGLENLVNEMRTLPVPDITFSGGETFSSILKNQDLPSEVFEKLAAWKVIHTPGHTPGSCCFFNKEEKLLISGDTVFYHSYGRTDLDGGSESDIIKSLKYLIEKLPGDTKVYPGHDYFGFDLGTNY